MLVEQVLVKHGARHAMGAEYQMRCPFHQDSDPSLSVNVSKGVFICFGCGEKGKLGKLVRKLTGGTAEIATSSDSTEQAKAEIALPSDYTPLWQKPRSQYAKLALAYVFRRGITLEQLARYRIGYCGNGFFTGRLIVPVYTRGCLMSFVARDFTGRAENKVKYPRGSRTSEALFGYDQMRKEGRLGTRVVITEGWADALAVDRELVGSSKTGVVALGSNRISMSQVGLLSDVGEFVILLDSDQAGRDGAREIGGILSTQCDSVRIVKLSSCKDPAEAAPGVLRKVLQAAGCYK